MSSRVLPSMQSRACSKALLARMTNDSAADPVPSQLAGYKLLIIDELGYVPLSATGAELLFEVFSQRYERGSTLVTSNLPFDEWTSVFGSSTASRITSISSR
jgi:DNA replication protein DnaC